jgi:hypothetical protein
MFQVILYMLRQTLCHRASPLPFPSFSPLTVIFPKLAFILRPLYATLAIPQTGVRTASSPDNCLCMTRRTGGRRFLGISVGWKTQTSWPVKLSQSTSWEPGSSPAGHKLRSHLWNRTFHYRVHKTSPPIPVLSKMNPVHNILVFHSANVHLTLFFHKHLHFVGYLLPAGVSIQHFVCIIFFTYVPCPVHPILNLFFLKISGEEYELWSSYNFLHKPIPPSSSLFRSEELRSQSVWRGKLFQQF